MTGDNNVRENARNNENEGEREISGESILRWSVKGKGE